MKEDLDANLVEKYPLIFANRHADMKTTSMCWGFENGDGWYNIIDRLCACIQGHIDWRNEQRESLLKSNPYNVSIPDEVPQVVAQQVKEKFGELRFYYIGGDDEIEGMVRMAEAMSMVTCEMCGSPGQLRSGGWIRTLCDDHEKEYQERYL